MSSRSTRLAAVVAAAAAAPLVTIGVAAGTTSTEIGPVYPPVCFRSIDINDRAVYEGTATTTPYLNTLVVLTVTSSGCDRAGTVDWQTRTGTANTFDYFSNSGTITFAAGDDAAKSIPVWIRKDGSPGSDEYFWVQLHDPSSGIHIADTYGKVIIVDDDSECIAPPDLPPGHPSWHCME